MGDPLSTFPTVALTLADLVECRMTFPPGLVCFLRCRSPARRPSAFYGWTTPGKIIKRPRLQDAPKAPTKWVLLGHSLGTLGVELVRRTFV